MNNEEPQRLIIANIKYASKNNSNLLHSSFSPFFINNFTKVKTVATIAKIPIDSDCANTDVTMTANIENNISESRFCKILLFWYKKSSLFWKNAKSLLNIISPYFVLVYLHQVGFVRNHLVVEVELVRNLVVVLVVLVVAKF